MSGILVAQGQERFIKELANYSQEESVNKLEYITGQNTNGQKRAMDIINHGLAPISTANVVAVGSSKRVIKKVAHGARKNDVVQFTSGGSIGVSIQILSCPDADTMILASTSEFPVVVGDTFDIKRYVTPQYDVNGALVVISTPGPAQFVLNGSDVEVEEDDAVPANNKPMPSKMYIQKDGVTRPVNKDTGTAVNTVAIPVEIVGVAGQTINITAGDINIQTTSEGAQFDSMRIGSGVGLYAEITINSELSTHDQDLLDAVGLLAKKTDTQPVSVVGTVAVVAAAQTGVFDHDDTVTTVAETFIAPAGAFACFIETDDTANTTNARVVMGGVATTTVGIQFQPGRSEFYQGGSNISYCMESGTGKISVQWFVR